MEKIEHVLGKKERINVSQYISSINCFLFSLLFLLYSNGYLLNEIFERHSLPPIFTILRLFVLIAILFRCIKGHYLLSSNMKFVVYFILIMSLYFITICIVDGEFSLGLISLRTYIEPFLVFFVVSLYIKNTGITTHLATIYVKTIFLTAIISLIFHSIYYCGYLDYFISEYPKACFLPGMIFRSYLPIGDPNAMGLLLSCGIIVVHLSNIKCKKIYISFLILSLLLTFSKSAILMLLLFFSLQLLTKMKNIIKVFFLLSVILGCGYIILEYFFHESPLYSYFTNLFAGEDPSSNGHLYSYIEAIEKFPEYYLFGYPTGTVGSRMTDMIYNVESSYFILLYDKGIIFFFMYISIVLMLLINIIKYPVAIKYILSIMLGLFFLPTIQSVECLSLVAISPLFILRRTRSH